MQHTFDQKCLMYWLIQDTVRYFENNHRALVANSEDTICKYRTEEGYSCAMGRFIPNDQYSELMDANIIGTAAQHIMEKWPTCLPKHLYDLGPSFWCALQSFHDSMYNWVSEIEGKNKLTKAGTQHHFELVRLNFCYIIT